MIISFGAISERSGLRTAIACRLLAVAMLLVHGGASWAQTTAPSATGCTVEGGAFRTGLATGGVDHPLAGTAFATGTAAVMSHAAFERLFRGTLLPSAAIVLLGEVHDNPDHHVLRAALIGSFACAMPAPRAVVLEHIRADQQPALDDLARASVAPGKFRSNAELFRVLEWDKSGWPAATMFAPLFDAAIATGLAILPGDPPRGRVRALARGEAGAVPVAERVRLRLDEPMPQPLLDALAAELKDSHCGVLPLTAIAGLSAAQRYRDAHQADAVLAAAETHGGAVLLAGNGHVRTDRGVPWHIRQRAPERKTVSVMFLEVEAGSSDPQAYVPRAPDGRPATDYVVLTPRAERPDPCEAMRRQMQNKG